MQHRVKERRESKRTLEQKQGEDRKEHRPKEIKYEWEKEIRDDCAAQHQ